MDNSNSPHKKQGPQTGGVVHTIPPLSSSSTQQDWTAKDKRTQATIATCSSPISLPSSHIRRTPSEVQLAADTLRAKYKDHEMYSRLLLGMHQQMQQRCAKSGSLEVHPLSAKSLRGVIHTNQDDDHELLYLPLQQAEQDQEDNNNDDDGWRMSYSFLDMDLSEAFSVDSSSGTEAAETTLTSSTRQASKDSMWTMLQEIENCRGLEAQHDDDCVFSLEL